MVRSREFRRYERAKAKARARARANFRLGDIRTWDSKAFERWINLSAVTPHPCSNYCCGNPRRYFSGQDRLTMAERRFIASQDE